MLLVTTTSYAYDVCIDGIYYNLEGTSAFVTYKDNSYNSYSGNVVIPSTITHEGKQYTVEAILSSAFRDSKKLTSVVIPDVVKRIERNAFTYCSLLSKINIPSTITKIENATFAYCESLTNIVLPKNLKGIGSSAFSSSGLISIELPEGIETIEDLAFYECRSLKRVNLPSTLVRIEWATFQDCRALEMIEIPSSIKSIGKSAFASCYELSQVLMSTGLEEINQSAFTFCMKLNNVCIPSTVEFIGSYAFTHCDKLMDITSMSYEPPVILENAFDDRIYANATLYVPNTNDAISKYKSSGTWGKFKTILTMDAAGVEILSLEMQPSAVFTSDGRRINEMQNGINIIRREDGKTMKVLKK